MYQRRPLRPSAADPSSATIASYGRLARRCRTIASSARSSASETRSVALDFARSDRAAGHGGGEESLPCRVGEPVRPRTARDVQTAGRTRRGLEHRAELLAGEVDVHDDVAEREHLIELPVGDLPRGKRAANAGHV